MAKSCRSTNSHLCSKHAYFQQSYTVIGKVAMLKNRIRFSEKSEFPWIVHTSRRKCKISKWEIWHERNCFGFPDKPQMVVRLFRWGVCGVVGCDFNISSEANLRIIADGDGSWWNGSKCICSETLVDLLHCVAMSRICLWTTPESLSPLPPIPPPSPPSSPFPSPLDSPTPSSLRNLLMVSIGFLI